MKTQKAPTVQIQLFMLFILAVFILNGCQKEIIQIARPQADHGITPHSKVKNLVARIALRDGSYDNILDKSSCISLKLPVTVDVNGQSIVIHSPDEFHFVEEALDSSNIDNDTLRIIFPVTIIKADYTEQLVQNQAQLDLITKACIEGGADPDIECVDFQYPLRFSTYDSFNQVSGVQTIKNDSALYHFVSNLDTSVLVSLQFPVTLLLSGGGEINVNDNTGLEGSIENHRNGCNEDDNNNYHDDNADDTEFIKVLTHGAWKITHFLDGTDQSSSFTNFSFTFNEDGTALATDGNSSTNGNWESYGDNGYLGVELDFGLPAPFNTIREDWRITEFGSQVIKLKHVSYKDGSEKTLVLEIM